MLAEIDEDRDGGARSIHDFRYCVLPGRSGITGETHSRPTGKRVAADARALTLLWALPVHYLGFLLASLRALYFRRPAVRYRQKHRAQVINAAMNSLSHFTPPH